MVILKIKNTTDVAFRFSSTLAFLPGETVAINEADVKARPVIQVLINAGKFEVVGGQGEPDKKSVEPEVIEEA